MIWTAFVKLPGVGIRSLFSVTYWSANPRILGSVFANMPIHTLISGSLIRLP